MATARAAICVCFTLAAWASTVLANSAPVVSHVTASQRADHTKVVDIYYTLANADGDACTVTVQASSDGGATWTVPITAVSGAVGSGISPGSGRHIVWNCGTDIPTASGTQFRVRRPRRMHGRVAAVPLADSQPWSDGPPILWHGRRALGGRPAHRRNRPCATIPRTRSSRRMPPPACWWTTSRG